MSEESDKQPSTVESQPSDWKNRGGAEGGGIPWCLPKEGQRPATCSCFREIDEDGREDPLTYHGCGCWWWTYMFCGADEENLFVDYEEKGYLKEILEITGKDYPPAGRERAFDIDLDTVPTPLPDELKSRHFNVQTLFYHLRLHLILEFFKRYYPVYFIMQCMICAVVPCIWILLVYALIPMSDPTLIRDDCDIGYFAVWLFFTNPISEISIVVTNVTLLFACLDDDLPWRPFLYYLPLLLVIYVAQVLFFLPFVLTDVKTFPYQGIVGFFISDLLTFFWCLLMRRRLIDFRDNEKNEETKKKMELRYNAYLRSIWMRFSAVCVYSAYLYGLQRLSDDAVNGLNVLLGVGTTLFRVVLQRQFAVFHKDMNFYMAFLSLYGGVAMFYVFATPAFDDEIENFFTAAIAPITFVIWGVVHQTKTWFRFRCWLKKCYLPSFCQKNSVLMLAIWEDVDFDDRGSDNFFPSYQRVKVQNEITSMMATMYSSLFYLCVSPSLRHLPNKRHFPYRDGDDVLVISATGEYEGFSDGDWERSLVFAALVFVYVAASMWLFRIYIFYFFPSLRPTFREFMWKAHEQPHKLGYQMMIMTMVGMGVVKLFMSYSRVWWVESDICALSREDVETRMMERMMAGGEL